MDCKKVILREQDVRGQVLDHLGLVSSVISRLKLIEKIDARIKVSKDKGAKITMGQRMAAMILNGLGFTDDRLYMFPQFLESHSGNASDKKILQAGAARMHAFCEQLKTSPQFLYVGDSAFYERCIKEKVLFLWLSRVPERLKEAKKWLHMEDSAFTWSPLDINYDKH
jgi:transposase